MRIAAWTSLAVLTVFACTPRDSGTATAPTLEPDPAYDAGQAVTEAGNANWHSYRPEEYPWIEIEHPASLEPREQEVADSPETAQLLHRVRFVRVGTSVGPLAEREPPPFAMDILLNPDALSIEEWLDRNGWPFPETTREVSHITVANRNSLELSSRAMVAPRRMIYLSYRDYLIRLIPLGRASEKMIKSVRFHDS